MRILLIEDDVQIGTRLLRALKENMQCAVDWVRDGVAGQQAIEQGAYAIILLDLGLPRMSGTALLRWLRAAGNETPLLILTAHDDLDTRVQGLDAGADDFLQKPFEVPELLARMRAVLRRKAGYATSSLGDDSMRLNLDTRCLTYGGLTEPLSAREFALMLALLERPGTILSRAQLEQRIYGWGQEVESNAVDVLIYSVRKKFGAGVIRNVRGLGWTVLLGGDNAAPPAGPSMPRDGPANGKGS
ncbi:DNA-binding response OmpR family regulator [Cupriavidus gilardii J11]|uniref:DNA-binding response OmpR family regulator n=1 Tax=Cupriavidus gilardii J11 TaxID=936133 RepID=A0A562BIW4_9BURK|nr:response regulator transcription factor [Cupriavidus gilardii]TWG84973.1 DNA-binding response OmpR family regulator [Cupriavidus gilardii J11]